VVPDTAAVDALAVRLLATVAGDVASVALTANHQAAQDIDFSIGSQAHASVALDDAAMLVHLIGGENGRDGNDDLLAIPRPMYQLAAVKPVAQNPSHLIRVPGRTCAGRPAPDDAQRVVLGRDTFGHELLSDQARRDAIEQPPSHLVAPVDLFLVQLVASVQRVESERRDTSVLSSLDLRPMLAAAARPLDDLASL
jgi:hypothetical protein